MQVSLNKGSSKLYVMELKLIITFCDFHTYLFYFSYDKKSSSCQMYNDTNREIVEPQIRNIIREYFFIILDEFLIFQSLLFLNKLN